jgi:hypothetical protein
MEFKFKLEDIVFYIKLEEDPLYKPQTKTTLFTSNELKNLKSGHSSVYSLFIHSEKKDQSLYHYVGGLILTSNKEKVSKELEEILEHFDYIDQVLADWTLSEETEGPRWRNKY